MQIVRAPDNRLRIKTKYVKKISSKYHRTIKEMINLTRTFIDPEGVGLASTQIGEDEQYFVMKLDDGTFKAIFNPQILNFSKKTKVYFEGCLSIPDYYGEVERPLSITVTYQTENGNKIKEKLSGIPAWIFQHEFDHLHGKLFMDRILEQKSRLFKVVGKDRAGAEIFEEVAL